MVELFLSPPSPSFCDARHTQGKGWREKKEGRLRLGREKFCHLIGNCPTWGGGISKGGGLRLHRSRPSKAPRRRKAIPNPRAREEQKHPAQSVKNSNLTFLPLLSPRFLLSFMRAGESRAATDARGGEAAAALMAPTSTPNGLWLRHRRLKRQPFVERGLSNKTLETHTHFSLSSKGGLSQSVH